MKQIVLFVVVLLSISSNVHAQQGLRVGLDYSQPSFVQTEDYLDAQGNTGTKFSTKTFEITVAVPLSDKVSVEGSLSRSYLNDAKRYFHSNTSNSDNLVPDWNGHFSQNQLGISYSLLPHLAVLGGIASTKLKLVSQGVWCCTGLKFTQTETQRTKSIYAGLRLSQPLSKAADFVAQAQTGLFGRRNDTLALTNYPDVIGKNQSLVADDISVKLMIDIHLSEHVSVDTGYKYRQFTAPTGGGISIFGSTARWSETTRLQGLVVGASYRF